MTEVDFTDNLWMFASPWIHEDKLEDDRYANAIARSWVALWNYTIDPTSIRPEQIRRVCKGLFDLPTKELIDILAKRKMVFFPDDNRLVEEYRVGFDWEGFRILVEFVEPNG